MNLFRFIASGIFFAIFISWAYIPPVSSQAVPGFIAQERINKLFKEFPELKERTEQFKAFETPRGNQEKVNLKEVLQEQTIFSPLLHSGADPKGILDLIFENVTSTCANHFRYALNSIFWFNGVPETWVLQMFDSYGKIPSGILSGHTSTLGDFHECVQIRGEYTPEGSTEAQIVNGRYATTYVFPGPELMKLIEQAPGNSSTMEVLSPGLRESVSFQVLIGYIMDLTSLPWMVPMAGACFPESCSIEDIQQILTSYHVHVSQDYVSQVVVATYTDEKPSFDVSDYVMIVVLAFIGVLCLSGTLWDIQRSPKEGNSHDSPGFAMKLLLAFSFYTNTKKWASTKVGSDNLGCLHGLRFLSMAWVVLCHTFSMILSQPTWNLVDVKMLYRDWSFYPIMNGTPSVDTFFALSGTLVAYSLLKELDKTKGKLNYPLFVIHRYLRLTPTYLILMGVMATLLPYFGNGPLWYTMDAESKGCQDFWWHNALYVNNLITHETTGCYGEAWYLANDMQFYLLSPLVIYPLWRWKRIGFGILTVLSIASVVIPAWIIADKSLPPTLTPSINLKTYMADIYLKPWARFGPYVIGLGLGYILHYRVRNLGKFRAIPKLVIAAGWALCTALALAVIFGGMYYFDPVNADDTFSSFHTAIYGGLHRTIWGVCICWIIFACVSGYGGWVNKFLSLKLFMPLGRLTFCMYITAYHIQFIYHSSVPHAEHFSMYRVVNIFFAHMVMSGLTAYILTMALESPFIHLEKMIFASRTPARPVQQANNLKLEEANVSNKSASDLSIKIENGK
ncbi:unnamed protein product [Allacma fusca]|uniref:Nose resistant-to-fluoxetine protein N-terminal domain-containing protein n=1 Tax=Allacma fusca TaxID=39272 RepID=A0A8J2NZQ1_9HEXA|nr:unnamed protein product [Allacma fusca]